MIRFFALSFLLVGFLWGSAAQAERFFVSPTEGNDAWSGRLAEPNAEGTDGPFRTLEKAKGIIPFLSGRDSDVEIILREGIYPLEKPLLFQGDSDSGTEQSRVIFRAADGETVLITGGKVLRNFEPWKGHAPICRTNVREQGLDGVDFKVLVCDGVRQRLARWPNFDPENPYAGGWAYADGAYVPPYATVEGEDRHTLRVKESDMRPWSRPTELRVMVFPRYN